MKNYGQDQLQILKCTCVNCTVTVVMCCAKKINCMIVNFTSVKCMYMLDNFFTHRCYVNWTFFMKII